MVDEIIEKYRHYDGADKVTFRTEINSSAPFLGDSHRVRMVIGNIISNAIRYHDPRKTESTVYIEIVQNRDKAVIRITDNGIGIDEKLMPEIFEMFTKSDGKNVGAGIGLYIAREAMKKLGGKISVTSTPEEGTRFTVEVPNKA